MRLFATGGRARASGPHRFGASATGGRGGLPVVYGAVAEALAAGECPLAACDAAGRKLALDGASVQEALAGLQQVWQSLNGQDPDYTAVQTLMTSWGETTLAAVNSISCEDPMTGLSSIAHLHSCVSAVFREHEQGGEPRHPRDTHAFVVVDLSADPGEDGRDDRSSRGGAAPVDPLAKALRMARLGEGVRTVFAGSDVVGRVGAGRVAVLTRRDERLGLRVRLVRRLVDGMDLSGRRPRVWIEGLPASGLGSAALLDELARG